MSLGYWYLEINNLSFHGNKRMEVLEVVIAGLGDFSLPMHILDQITFNLLKLPQNNLYLSRPNDGFNSLLANYYYHRKTIPQMILGKMKADGGPELIPVPMKTFYNCEIIQMLERQDFDVEDVIFEYKYSVSAGPESAGIESEKIRARGRSIRK